MGADTRNGANWFNARKQQTKTRHGSKTGILNVGVEQSLRLDAGKSFDPEGDALRFTWEAPQAGATLQDLSTSENNVQFTLPGWYDLTVSTVDSASNRHQTRQASVYGRHGFSGFGD